MKNKKTYAIFILVLSLNTVIGQSLDSLLHLVVENNPELKALDLEYKAILAKKDQAGQLQNPTLGVAVPVLRPETRLGPQVFMVSASQMFPWFGTLDSKENAVISMSKAKLEHIAGQKLELFHEVKDAYYRLYFIQEKEQLLQEFIATLKSLEKLSLAKVEAGKVTMADVLRIQLKMQEIENQLVHLENAKKGLSAKITSVTNQNMDVVIDVEAPEDSIAPLVFNLTEYEAKIKNHHPMMRKINAQIEVSQSKQMINENMGKPMIGVGLDYNMVGERTDMNPENNGRDILVPKLMFTLPIYRKGYKAKNEEERLRQESLEIQKTDIVNKMLSMLIQYKVSYDNALSTIELMKRQKSTTLSANKILLEQYAVDGNSFEQLIQTELLYLNYEMQLINARMDTFIARTNVERLTDF